MDEAKLWKISENIIKTSVFQDPARLNEHLLNIQTDAHKIGNEGLIAFIDYLIIDILPTVENKKPLDKDHRKELMFNALQEFKKLLGITNGH